MKNARAIDAVVDWLMGGVEGAKTPADVVGKMCPQLVDAGVPVDRCEAFVRTLHPSIGGRSFLWKPGQDVVVGEQSYATVHAPEMDAYAMADVFRTRNIAHRATAGSEAPDLVRLHNEGYVDWVGAP